MKCVYHSSFPDIFVLLVVEERTGPPHTGKGRKEDAFILNRFIIKLLLWLVIIHRQTLIMHNGFTGLEMMD